MKVPRSGARCLPTLQGLAVGKAAQSLLQAHECIAEPGRLARRLVDAVPRRFELADLLLQTRARIDRPLLSIRDRLRHIRETVDSRFERRQKFRHPTRSDDGVFESLSLTLEGCCKQNLAQPALCVLSPFARSVEGDPFLADHRPQLRRARTFGRSVGPVIGP